jgi:uncharacterized protein
MNKKINILIVLTCLLLTGCSKKETLEVTEENIIVVSSEIAKAFQDGNYSEVYNVLNKESKKDVTKDKIKSGWDSIISDAGTFNSMDVKAYRPDDRDLGYVIFDYENKTIKLSLRFDDKMNVERMNINEVHKIVEAIETEDFIESNVQVGYGNMLDGMLTLPKGVDNPPVVILLQGSGSSNLNEEILVNKPFEDLAHGLAKQGIASIRYDKRYYAYPEWDSIREVSLAWEYFNDFSAVVHQLEDMPVNHNEIYLIGHSQGGVLAPRLAYENPEIKGFISLAGSVRGLEEVIKDQQINALLAQGFTMDELSGQIKSIDDNIAKIQSLTKETADDYVIWNLPLTYWYELNQSRAKIYANELQCDMLILQGEEDFQVFVDSDYVEWQKLFEGMDNVQFRSYPGLNHLFMPSIEGTTADYEVPAHIDDSVIKDITSWIQNRKLVKEEKK